MKIEEIVLLTKAGYTKEDIEKLVASPVEAEAVPVEVNQEEQIEPVQNPEVVPADDRLTKLETKLDYVINRFNYMEVRNSKQPESQAGETVDDILAKMIR